MKNSKKRIFARGLLISTALAFGLGQSALAQDTNDHLKASKGQSFKASAFSGQPATRSAIADFIASNKGDFSGKLELVTDSSFKSKFGQTHMRMHQEVNGLRVHCLLYTSPSPRDA